MKSMDERIVCALNRTWQAIGADVLELGEGVVGRDIVEEMVCDADRLLTYGGDKEAAEAFYELLWDSKERKELILQAFPFENYC